jgi:hypothetical protein
MLTFEQFKHSPFCKPLVLPPEEEIQDAQVFKTKEKEFQEEQYKIYAARYDPELNQKIYDKGVVQQKSKRDKYWWREYRKRPRYCPNCKHEL